MSNETRGLLWTFGVVLLLLALPSIACTGWFFFDGIVTYPDQQERWEAYERVQREHPTTTVAAWSTLARDRGWPIEPPPRRTDMDVLTQYVMGGTCAASSLVLIGASITMLWIARRRPAPADDGLPSALG